jgi:hypothetical protein
MENQEIKAGDVVQLKSRVDSVRGLMTVAYVGADNYKIINAKCYWYNFDDKYQAFTIQYIDIPVVALIKKFKSS